MQRGEVDAKAGRHATGTHGMGTNLTSAHQVFDELAERNLFSNFAKTI